jgi:hypothetical protein
MTIQVAVSAIFFLISMGCMVRANLLFGEIGADINRLLNGEQAISLAGFVRHRFFEILSTYRKLYPDGKLVFKLQIWAAIGFACFLGSVCYWFFSGAGSAGYIPRHR